MELTCNIHPQHMSHTEYLVSLGDIQIRMMCHQLGAIDTVFVLGFREKSYLAVP